MLILGLKFNNPYLIFNGFDRYCYSTLLLFKSLKLCIHNIFKAHFQSLYSGLVTFFVLAPDDGQNVNFLGNLVAFRSIKLGIQGD